MRRNKNCEKLWRQNVSDELWDALLKDNRRKVLQKLKIDALGKTSMCAKPGRL
jgi:hypothetical protein